MATSTFVPTVAPERGAIPPALLIVCFVLCVINASLLQRGFMAHWWIFDENGLGEPAVWNSHGFYWMLYTGRDREEHRRLGLARSLDGVHWLKQPAVFGGGEAWNSKVVCDASVLVEGGTIRVWFGGGDVASPDENLNGQIGYGVLRPVSATVAK